MITLSPPQFFFYKHATTETISQKNIFPCRRCARNVNLIEKRNSRVCQFDSTERTRHTFMRLALQNESM